MDRAEVAVGRMGAVGGKVLAHFGNKLAESSVQSVKSKISSIRQADETISSSVSGCHLN